LAFDEFVKLMGVMLRRYPTSLEVRLTSTV
jgi:hypothetical protein